jgi:hypothetical protein
MAIGLGGKKWCNVGTLWLCVWEKEYQLGWELWRKLMCNLKNLGIVGTYIGWFGSPLSLCPIYQDWAMGMERVSCSRVVSWKWKLP